VGPDADGKIFVADFRNGRIPIVDAFGAIVSVAGTETYDGRYTGPGSLVGVGCPAGLATGRDGRVYSSTPSRAACG
jgi:hypothetical protein